MKYQPREKAQYTEEQGINMEFLRKLKTEIKQFDTSERHYLEWFNDIERQFASLLFLEKICFSSSYREQENKHNAKIAERNYEEQIKLIKDGQSIFSENDVLKANPITFNLPDSIALYNGFLIGCTSIENEIISEINNSGIIKRLHDILDRQKFLWNPGYGHSFERHKNLNLVPTNIRLTALLLAIFRLWLNRLDSVYHHANRPHPEKIEKIKAKARELVMLLDSESDFYWGTHSHMPGASRSFRRSLIELSESGIRTSIHIVTTKKRMDVNLKSDHFKTSLLDAISTQYFALLPSALTANGRPSAAFVETIANQEFQYSLRQVNRYLEGILKSEPTGLRRPRVRFEYFGGLVSHRCLNTHEKPPGVVPTYEAFRNAEIAKRDIRMPF